MADPNAQTPPAAAVPDIASLITTFNNISLLLADQLKAANARADNPPTAAQSIPAFVSVAPPPSKSLPELFPRVKASLLLDIARHDFEPLDLFKLDSRFRDRSDKSHLDVESGSVLVRARTGSLKDYPSLQSLLTPLNVYFDILLSFAASAGDAAVTRMMGHGALAYSNLLLDLNQKYDWAAVVQYHMDFHMDRVQEMSRGDYSGWAHLDTQLISQHLVSRVRLPPSTGGAPASSRPRGVAKDKVASSAQICFSFNGGTCTASPCPSGRIHKCRRCDAMDHGDVACPLKPKKT